MTTAPGVEAGGAGQAAEGPAGLTLPRFVAAVAVGTVLLVVGGYLRKE